MRGVPEGVRLRFPHSPGRASGCRGCVCLMLCAIAVRRNVLSTALHRPWESTSKCTVLGFKYLDPIHINAICGYPPDRQGCTLYSALALHLKGAANRGVCAWPGHLCAASPPACSRATRPPYVHDGACAGDPLCEHSDSQGALLDGRAGGPHPPQGPAARAEVPPGQAALAACTPVPSTSASACLAPRPALCLRVVWPVPVQAEAQPGDASQSRCCVAGIPDFGRAQLNTGSRGRLQHQARL